MSKVIFQITADDLAEAKKNIADHLWLTADQWNDLEQFVRMRLKDKAPYELEEAVIDFLDEEVQ